MNSFRRENGLLTVEATQQWLAERGMSATALENSIAARTKLMKLRSQTVGGEVDTHFDKHRDDFRIVKLAVLKLPDFEEAVAIF